jgi:hypothetical protein
MNVEFICGRIEDLCIRLESLIPAIADVHNQYEPDDSREYVDYVFTLVYDSGVLSITCMYMPDDVMVATGVWNKGYVVIGCHTPTGCHDGSE